MINWKWIAISFAFVLAFITVMNNQPVDLSADDNNTISEPKQLMSNGSTSNVIFLTNSTTAVNPTMCTINYDANGNVFK